MIVTIPSPLPLKHITPIQQTSDHLIGRCADRLCDDPACPEMVTRNPATDAWYITMGHAGFNSWANNRWGYTTANGARRVVRGLLAKRRAR